MKIKQASIQSNAFNFSEFLAGGIDPRTGLYTCSLTLGEVTCGVLTGPTLPIRLFFSPLNGGDSGFGKGWSMPLTHYDVVSGVLTLSGGESYKARQTSTQLVFAELKLETLKVLCPGPGRFDVVHKSGLREELQVYGASGMAVPIRIVAANGAAIMLDYISINGEPVLSQVRDDRRTLLAVTRTPGQVSLTEYPDTECAVTFALKLVNDEVTSIRLPEEGTWSLTYEPKGALTCLTKVESPLGARELIGYEEAGHQLPPDAPFRSIPHVISHTLYPGQQQPSITTNYEFSQTNFLGFDDDDIRWSRDGDTLYQSSSDYQYSSMETLMDGAKVHRRTQRTYNKYHLLVSQVTTCNQALTAQTIKYHVEPDKSFDQQPAQFRMPRVQTLLHENRKTRTKCEEVTETDFDASGNLLRHVAPNGVVTLAQFYPANGDEGCPADPLGFIRFEKHRTVLPAPGFASAATTEFRYRYQLLGEPQAAGSHVVLVQETFYERSDENDTLRSQTDLTYVDLPTDTQRHGLLQKQTVTYNGQASATEFHYTLDTSTLDLQTLQIGFDGARRTSSLRFSATNGLKLSEQNEDEGQIVFTYDRLGRVLSETIAPGSDVAATRLTRYLPANGPGSSAKSIITDPNGVQQRISYDGIGRVIEIEEQDADQSSPGEFRQVYAASHDRLGQLTGEVHTDWWPGQTRALHTRFVFDDWGEVKTTIRPDGRREHRDADPVSRQETTWQEGMGKSVTLFNDFGKPVSIELLDTGEQSLGKQLFEYDGLGRSVGQTDPLGNRTTFEYDVFDRLTRSVLPDGHAVQTDYAAHSREPLPVAVTMAGRTVGQQRFDGLGRLVQSSCGGRTSSAGYIAGSSQPAWKQRPDGERIEFRYEPGLGGRMTQRQATGLLARYDYHPRLGELARCVEQECETRFEYYPSGRLKRETSTVAASQQSSSYTYTLGGRPLSCIDVLGDEHKTDYDDAGRPRSFEQRALKASFAYNELGQLSVIDTRAAVGEGSLVTHLAYDDLGREVSRTFQIGDETPRVLTSSYTLAGKLAQKTLKQGDEDLRDEAFTYDARGRLSHYSCSGSRRPRDARGHEIIAQRYTFDAFDNIISLETEFPGGSNLASFDYSAEDPTQLIGIRNSHPDYPAPVTLHYDANGHLIQDELARRLEYDALGRLTAVASAVGDVLRSYHYDARDRLVGLSQPAGPMIKRFYRDGQVINDIGGPDASTLLRPTGVLLGESRQGSHPGVMLFGVDQQQSVLSERQGTQSRHHAYSPYGHRPAEGGLFSLLGFNGEPLDPLTGLYLLGNGYRAYSPALMRFLSPDSLSPFGAGGLNPYAYCAGDPINRMDPTGHVWEAVLGITLAVAGLALSVVTAGAATPLTLMCMALAATSTSLAIAGIVVDELAPESGVGEVLGWASLATGGMSAVGGLGALGKGAIKTGNKIAGAFKPGLSGDPKTAAKAMASGMKKGKAKKPPPMLKGKGAKKNARAALAADGETSAPAKWTRTGAGDESIPAEMKPSQLGEWTIFRDGLDQGLHPKAASTFMSNPDFEKYGGTSNQWSVRLGGKDRVTFSIHESSHEVKILQIGGHS
ncbi:type IV secretion protein Rhs [Pseudomonas sp. PDM32]|uniref:RHS repeat domain-containing protein n=1 Tax=Pseudomonas sp. PDM32 TaxID=2854768 RepID=UPI001C48C074|nr:RHS repeat-associated core domain-containing protein [Pseudomonas sp. PDM32]MBV7574071.1 type IV secretion protein Rhs [Pseudomonas sp. PDM32]